jgi:hypothetical protein
VWTGAWSTVLLPRGRLFPVRRGSYCIVTVQFPYLWSRYFTSHSNARTPSCFLSALLEQVSRNLKIYLR